MSIKKFITLFCLFINLSLFCQTNALSSNFRFDFNGGFGYCLASQPEISTRDENYEAYTSFIHQLSWMKNLQTSLYYKLSKGSYLGLKYYFMNSSGSVKDIQFDTMDNHGIPVTLIGDLSEKQYVNYIGPSYMYADWLGYSKKWLCSYSLTTGYASYRCEEKNYMTNYLITSHSIGLGIDLGIDYFITKPLSVGVKTGLFIAKFTNIVDYNGVDTQNTTLDSKNAINLSNVNLSIGVSYHFK